MKIVLCLWREGGGDPCQPQALLVVALPAGGPGGQLAVVAGHPIYRFIGPRQQPDLHNIGLRELHWTLLSEQHHVVATTYVVVSIILIISCYLLHLDVVVHVSKAKGPVSLLGHPGTELADKETSECQHLPPV